MSLDDLHQPATFSPDRKHRYTLRRVWASEWTADKGLFPPPKASSFAAFIGLNPSTADETQDDPTVRRCVGFAKRWGFGGMFMLNIFALRSTDPAGLYKFRDPVGPRNDHFITQVAKLPEVGIVIAAWGNHGALLSRGWDVIKMVQGAGVLLMRFGPLTIPGQPRHPLYLKGDLMPEPL